MTDYQGTDIYCDLIIPRKVDVQIVAETSTVIAFHHTKPHWPVHIVVTCKEHVSSLLELDGTLALELLQVVKQVAAQVKDSAGRVEY